MPRSRFHRLAPEKQAQILEAAAREFAAHGYERASLNKILEEAQISKGAAYYYFEDKADLFATTVQHYASVLIGDLPLAIEQLDAESFWPTLTRYYVRQFVYSYDKPWAFGVVKAAGRVPAQDVAANQALARSFNEIHNSVRALLHKGQAVGVVRRDLPDELLAALFMGVDDASDQWLLRHWDELTRDEIADIVQRVITGVSRLLAPQNEDVL